MSTPATLTTTYSRKHRMDAEALQRNNKRIKETPASSAANSDQVFALQSSVGAHISPKDFSPVPAMKSKKTTASRRLKENSSSKAQGLASPFLKPQKPLQRTHANTIHSQSTKNSPVEGFKQQHHRRPSMPTPPRFEASTWLPLKQQGIDNAPRTALSPKVDFNRPPSQMDFNSMEVDLQSFAGSLSATSTPPPGSTSLQLMRNGSLTVGSDSSDEDVLRGALMHEDSSPFFSSSSDSTAPSLRSAINLPDSKALQAKELDIQRIFSSLDIERTSVYAHIPALSAAYTSSQLAKNSSALPPSAPRSSSAALVQNQTSSTLPLATAPRLKSLKAVLAAVPSEPQSIIPPCPTTPFKLPPSLQQQGGRGAERSWDRRTRDLRWSRCPLSPITRQRERLRMFLAVRNRTTSC